MGIVNAGNLPIYTDIDAAMLKVVEDAILNRHAGATEALLEFAQSMDKDKKKDAKKQDEWRALPVAERLLSPADWAELNKEFATDRDPLAGGARDPSYNRLFSRIVLSAPAPIGVGPAFETQSG